MTRIALPALFALIAIAALSLAQESDGQYPNPLRFREDIDNFLRADSANPPPAGAILCIGSSSMRLWHDSLAVDLAPLTVIPRGFGGSTMNDVLYFADDIVLPYRPRAIVLYEGDNDIAGGVAPAQVRDTFIELVRLVHRAAPETRFYVLSIKPSIRRKAVWPQMQAANRLLAGACADDERLTYVDVAAGMLDAEGSIRPDIFVEDKLHLNRKGYLTWRDLLKPVLMATELAFEENK